MGQGRVIDNLVIVIPHTSGLPPHPTIYSCTGTFFRGFRFMMMLTRGENLKVLLFEKL